MAIAKLESTEAAGSELAGDYVTLRGRRLYLPELVDQRLFDPGYLGRLREQMRKAEPFEHLVVEGWFHPTLLEVVREEFDRVPESTWMTMRGPQEHTLRSRQGARLGPAAELYFAIVNSGWFLDVLSAVSGVEDLLADPRLFGGGLHETRAGGVFGVHVDFDRHVRYGLRNELVLITYLNQDWSPSWGGAFELWDGAAKRCVSAIQPSFGRSVLMRHTPKSFHGHPTPLTPPPGKVRRSVAGYYYSNQFATGDRQARKTTAFLFPSVLDDAIRWARRLAPPLLWDAVTKVARRSRG
jgi:hypothetical protein